MLNAFIDNMALLLCLMVLGIVGGIVYLPFYLVSKKKERAEEAARLESKWGIKDGVIIDSVLYQQATMRRLHKTNPAEFENLCKLRGKSVEEVKKELDL